MEKMSCQKVSNYDVRKLAIMMSERGERLFLKGKYCAVSKEKL